MKQIEEILNLCDLPILNEETVLHILQVNYSKGQFYIWGGRTLLAINPCTVFQHLYTQERITYYRIENQLKNIQEPHIYAVAENARYMLSSELGKINQAIIVSGESGAGKTYTTAEVLRFLTSVATNTNFSINKNYQPERIHQKIIDSTPLLEAFGNASTSKNKNSSRFGKFVQLQYNRGQLVGAKISTYLLEKTRVTTITRGERSYNIFYQMIAGMSENDYKCWMLTDDVIQTLVGKITDMDKTKFQATRDAMNDIGLCRDTQNSIFQILSAILHLKKLNFKLDPEDDCIIVNENEKTICNIEAASALLGISSSTLKTILTVKTITAGKTARKSVFTKPCGTVNECKARRDCLIRFLYDSLFQWLVKFINQEVTSPAWDYFIGILDVYGFENFNYNSLEQLCINFANEKLQQYFVKDFLHDEQAIFIEEGIDFKLINYTDNKHCLELLEERSKTSVFGLLNEDCQLNWSNDHIIVTKKILETFKNNEFIQSPKDAKGKPLTNSSTFIIKHFAGDVEYSTEGLIEKNKDNIPEEYKTILADSSKTFITQMNPLIEMKYIPDKKTRKQTVLSKFKVSLDELVEKLNLCDGHYIRCLVPNTDYEPGYINSNYLLIQLRACGILESIAISQKGLPVRMKYHSFITHYYPLFGKNVKYLKKLSKSFDQNDNVTDTSSSKGQNGGILSVLQTACQQMISNLFNKSLSQQECQFGKLRIFLSSEMFHKLETNLLKLHSKAALIIQYEWKNYQKKRNRAAVVIQTAFRKWKNRCQYLKIRTATIKIQRAFRRYIYISRQNYSFITVKPISEEIQSFQTDGDTFHSVLDLNKDNSIYFSDENTIEALENECQFRNASYSIIHQQNNEKFEFSNRNFHNISKDEFRQNTFTEKPLNVKYFNNLCSKKYNDLNIKDKTLSANNNFMAKDQYLNNCIDTFQKNNLKNLEIQRNEIEKYIYELERKNDHRKYIPTHEETNENNSVQKLRKIFQVKSEFIKQQTFPKSEFEKVFNISSAKKYNTENKTDKENCRERISKSLFSFTTIQHLYIKDGLASIRRMPKTKIRFHTRLTPLSYSHIPPLNEIQCSLTDALEDETSCFIHRIDIKQ